MELDGEIALIGGSGFIGTRLARRLLEAGRKIRIIDIAPSRFYPEHWVAGDVRDRRSFQSALTGCTAIVNLAAQHKDNVRPASLYNEVNVEGSRQVCLAAEESGIRSIVFASSVAVYGNAPPNTGETAKTEPSNDYGRTKLEAESVYREWFSRSPVDRKLVIVRPTVVFGERNRGNVYNLLSMIARGRFVMVGRGQNIKSMAYVENVAAFLQFCLDMPPGMQLFNYVDKPDFTMKQLVSFVQAKLERSARSNLRVPFWLARLGGRLFDLLAACTGREWPISSIRVEKFCANTRFSADRLAETRFVPPVSLPDGLRRTLEFEFLQGDGSDGQVLFESE
jgi:nucleoside-diphosphate-sugar epimerase